jgi:hydroxymethylpyrimidine/phosphomethylpyrimidine kinase
MGNVIPDRFFWALPPGEDEADDAAAEAADDTGTAKSPRHVH